MMYQPPPIPPGTESWAERYGPIGVVALLALSALIIALRNVFAERKEDRTKAAAAQAEHDKQIRELYDRIVALARENDTRYQALLERTIQENRANIETMRIQGTASTEALRALLGKVQRGGE